MERVLSLLGLAKKAGKIADGERSAEESIKQKRAYLVLVAGDASDRTVRSFLRLCAEAECPIFRYGSRSSLGHAIGKKDRAVIALLDRGFSEMLKEKLLPKEVYGNED